MLGPVFSLLALALWIGGLVVMAAFSPWAGACLAAGGFVAAGAAMKRKDDMEIMFGLLFLLVLAIGAIRLVAWLLGF